MAEHPQTITLSQIAKHCKRSKQTVSRIKGLPIGVLVGQHSVREKHYPYEETMIAVNRWLEINDNKEKKIKPIVTFVYKGFQVEILKFVKSGLWARFGGYDEKLLKEGKYAM